MRQHVGVVLLVRGEQQADDLGLVVPAVGEQRAQRPVDARARSGSPSRWAGPRAGRTRRGSCPRRRCSRGSPRSAAGSRRPPAASSRRPRSPGRRCRRSARSRRRRPAWPVLPVSMISGLPPISISLRADQSSCPPGTALAAGTRPSAGRGVARGGRRSLRRRDAVWRAWRPALRHSVVFSGAILRSRLLAQAQLADDLLVTVEVLALQVVQQAAALADHLQQTLSRVVVLGVDLEVLGQVLDSPGEQRDLDFRATRCPSRGSGSSRSARTCSPC